MFNSLNRFGLPIKYGIIGLVGAVIALLVWPFIGYDTPISGIGILIVGAVGGFVGGLIRKNMGKNN